MKNTYLPSIFVFLFSKMMVQHVILNYKVQMGCLQVWQTTTGHFSSEQSGSLLNAKQTSQPASYPAPGSSTCDGLLAPD